MGARVATAKAVVAILVCVGLLHSRPFAAQESAVLSGTVTDVQGAVIPGATVTAKGDRAPERQVVTDERGTFRLLGLSPGTYTVRVELSGFRVEERTVVLTSGRTTTIAVALQVDQLTETVSVTSAAPRLQTESSTRSYMPTADQIMRMRPRHRSSRAPSRAWTRDRTQFAQPRVPRRRVRFDEQRR